MTPTMSKEDFAGFGGPDLVYVRKVRASELMSEAFDMQELPITPGQTLYAVHSADGSRLAIMADRASAFAAAMAHELAPVSVH